MVTRHIPPAVIDFAAERALRPERPSRPLGPGMVIELPDPACAHRLYCVRWGDCNERDRGEPCPTNLEEANE